MVMLPMTEVDERLLTAAKIHELAAGDLDGQVNLHEHAGLVADDRDRSVLSFLDGSDVALGELGGVIKPSLLTDEATGAISDGNADRLSAFVGVTEQELDASALTLPFRLLDLLENHGAPAFVSALGNPNAGKTDTVALLVKLQKLAADGELLVISNIESWTETDVLVRSAYDLAVTLLENRDVPKVVVLDECSTHMDARTYRREVAHQYTPLAKRYAKLNVEAEFVVCHTGKDLHPERKALTTLAFRKADKKTAEFFDSWDREEPEPAGKLFAGDVQSLEKAGGYDPDDAAPWNWNLPADLFDAGLSWSELLEELEAVGPAED